MRFQLVRRVCVSSSSCSLGRCVAPFVNSEGIAIRSTMDTTTTTQYAANLSQLAAKARSVVRDLDPQNDLTFLRVRTKKHEMMIAPEKDFMLLVVQNPNSEQ